MLPSDPSCTSPDPSVPEVNKVPQRIPSYLKLHVEGPSQVSRPNQGEIPGLSRLCAAFKRATGYTLRNRLDGAPVEQTPGLPRDRVDGENRIGPLCIEPRREEFDSLVPSAMDFAALEDLASSLGEVLQHLQQTRSALWQREAELAAGVPVTVHRDEEEHLAARLEAVLRAGSQAVGCQAAAAYMLDESSKHLKLRACWGLPQSRFLDPPRPLRGAVADLEALVGHAVVLEDTRLLSDWRVPEEFRSAVCVPISTPTTPLGTLWVFCDRPREFSMDESNLLEIVAGRIAADLEREMLLQQTLHSRTLARQLGYATQWQENRLPRIKPLLHGWQVAGKTLQGDHVGGDFHDWCVLPDESLAVAIGDAQGKMFEAGLTAAALHSALKSHSDYRHNAQELVERVNQTLWTASAGDQFASLFYALIQPTSGRVEYASAGHVYASIIGQQQRPLATDEEFPLGTQPDAVYPLQTDQMDSGDWLVVFSEGFKRSLHPGKQRLLWRLIHRHRERTADEMIGKLEEFMQQNARDGVHEDRTFLVVKRSNG